MTEKRICEYCCSPLEEGEACGCPGAEAAREARERMGEAAKADSCFLMIDKRPGEEGYRVAASFGSTVAAIQGLANLVRTVAKEMEEYPERIFAVLATVLFPPEQEGEDA